MGMVEIFGDRYELDTLELAALLASFGDNTGSYGSPQIDYGGVVVRYSRRTGQIEAVGPGEHGSWERQVRDLVNAHLLTDGPNDSIARGFLFGRSGIVDAFDEPISFGRAGEFLLVSEPTEAFPTSEGHPFHLAVAYRSSTVDTLEVFRHSRAVREAQIIISTLSPAATLHVFDNHYGANLEQHWYWATWRRGRDDRETVRCEESWIAQLGYRAHQWASAETVEELVGAGDERWDTLRSDFDRVHRLHPDDRWSFLNACACAHRGATTGSPTLRALAYTTAIESLLPNESESCSECGQPRYRVRQRFADMVADALGEDARKWAKEAYDARSGATHAGSWLGSEGEPDSFAHSPLGDVQPAMNSYAASKVLRHWLEQHAED